jgi:hypothetical protein
MSNAYEQWKKEFVKRLQERLKSDSVLKTCGEVYVQTIRKVNQGVREGLVMPNLNEAGASPVIYLDELYVFHQKGMSDEVLMQGVMDQFSRHQGMAIDISVLTDYEKVKEHLCIRVNGKDGNERWAEERVCAIEGDFIQSCYLEFLDSDGDFATVTVMKEHADQWGVSYEQVITQAREGSMRKPVEMNSIMEKLQLLGDGEVRNYLQEMDLLPKEEQMFILREVNSPFGAAVIARPDVLERVGEVLKDDYYILPSSVEEVLLIPAKVWDDPEKLSEMVKEINTQLIDPSIHLSDHVQYYDRERKRLMNALEYRYQKRSEERVDSGRTMTRKRSVRDEFER